MRTRTRIGVALAAVAVAAAAVAGYALDTPAVDQQRFDRSHSDLGPAAAQAFAQFPLYSAGDTFEGMALRAISRRDDAPAPAETVRADYVGFIYGDCVAIDESGCAPPLEIQVWPACERSLAD